MGYTRYLFGITLLLFFFSLSLPSNSWQVLILTVPGLIIAFFMIPGSFFASVAFRSRSNVGDFSPVKISRIPLIIFLLSLPFTLFFLVTDGGNVFLDKRFLLSMVVSSITSNYLFGKLALRRMVGKVRKRIEEERQERERQERIAKIIREQQEMQRKELEDQLRIWENEYHKKNYYAILGVPRDASDEEIWEAYITLAVKHHPDRARTDAERAALEEKIRELNEAYATLGSLSRISYDTTLTMVEKAFGRI